MRKIAIVGMGPTGLGAYCQGKALLLDCNIFEQKAQVGGLSASFIDDTDFTWDIGGHVLFSHFDYFDQAVEKALHGQYYEHMRECWVRILDTWIPYPFQNNIRYLPDDARDQCVNGLKNLPSEDSISDNFKEWMDSIFGEGIVKYFMEPYNFKVWATPPELMSKDWIAERVSVVDLERIEYNIREKTDDMSWGPNNMFKFPHKGGTGAIFKGIAADFSDKIKFDHDLIRVDLVKKQLWFANGQTANYDSLISTIPLDQLIEKCATVPADVRLSAEKLVHNGVYVVGLGFRGKRDDSRCWMYFPENNCPFYRVTNFHNYSPHNVPNGDIDNYFSLMCEISFSEYKSVAEDDIINETIQGLINTGMITKTEKEDIVSRYLIKVPYAYPVPTIERDEALAVIQPFLEVHQVYSRGRFGAWKYEVGNMDHSFMQGVEIAQRLLDDTVEKVFNSL